MKRIMALVLAAALLLLAQTALADGGNAVYANAPGVGTQDAVDEVKAVKEQAPYDIQILEPNEFSSGELTEIVRFVQVNQQPVVRYFPEYLQQEVAELAAPVDKDALYMTEFMRILPEESEKAQVETTFTFSVDYYVGQLVIVVMGVEDGDELLWHALPAEVDQEFAVSFTIPEEWQEKISGKETLFSLLVVSDGQGGDEWDEGDQDEEQEGLPSKTAQDTTRISVSENVREAANGVNFRIKLVEPSTEIDAELERIDEHLNAGNPLFTYFDEAIQARIVLLMGEDVDTDDIKGYVVESVMQENYHDNDDGYTAFTFAVPYEDGQSVVVAVGVPEDGAMRWVPNRAKVQDGKVHVIFSEAVLPQMGNEPALMIVLSTAFADEQ